PLFFCGPDPSETPCQVKRKQDTPTRLAHPRRVRGDGRAGKQERSARRCVGDVVNGPSRRSLRRSPDRLTLQLTRPHKRQGNGGSVTLQLPLRRGVRVDMLAAEGDGASTGGVTPPRTRSEEDLPSSPGSTAAQGTINMNEPLTSRDDRAGGYCY